MEKISIKRNFHTDNKFHVTYTPFHDNDISQHGKYFVTIMTRLFAPLLTEDRKVELKTNYHQGDNRWLHEGPFFETYT